MLKPSQVEPASQWEISGIEHELFTRALGSLAHKQVGPVSVARMIVSVLKKKTQQETLETESLIEYLQKMDIQLQEVVMNTRNIKIWNTTTSKELVSPSLPITQAAELMRMRLSFRNINVNIDVNGIEDNHEVNHSRFLYMGLALLGYFEDLVGLPSTINILRQTQKSFLISVAAESNQESSQTQSQNKINESALASLATYYFLTLSITPDQILFSWD